MPTFLKKKSVLVLGSEGHSTKILIKKKEKERKFIEWSELLSSQNNTN